MQEQARQQIMAKIDQSFPNTRELLTAEGRAAVSTAPPTFMLHPDPSWRVDMPAASRAAPTLGSTLGQSTVVPISSPQPALKVFEEPSALAILLHAFGQPSREEKLVEVDPVQNPPELPPAQPVELAPAASVPAAVPARPLAFSPSRTPTVGKWTAEASATAPKDKAKRLAKDTTDERGQAQASPDSQDEEEEHSELQKAEEEQEDAEQDDGAKSLAGSGLMQDASERRLPSAQGTAAPASLFQENRGTRAQHVPAQPESRQQASSIPVVPRPIDPRWRPAELEQRLQAELNALLAVEESVSVKRAVLFFRA